MYLARTEYAPSGTDVMAYSPDWLVTAPKLVPTTTTCAPAMDFLAASRTCPGMRPAPGGATSQGMKRGGVATATVASSIRRTIGVSMVSPDRVSRRDARGGAGAHTLTCRLTDARDQDHDPVDVLAAWGKLERDACWELL